MTTHALKQVYERIAEAVNTRQLDLLDTLYHPELVNHGADPDEPRGAYHFKHVFAELIAACPDLRVRSRIKSPKATRWSCAGSTGARTRAHRSGASPQLARRFCCRASTSCGLRTGS